VISSVLQRSHNASFSPLSYIRIPNILHIYCYGKKKKKVLCNRSGVVRIKVSFVLTEEFYVSVLSFRIYFLLNRCISCYW